MWFQWLMGGLTFAVSGFGLYVLSRQAYFFWRSQKTLGVLLSWAFATDAAMYLVVLLLGVWFFLGMELDDYAPLQAVRIVVMVLNVFVNWRLFRHYREYH